MLLSHTKLMNIRNVAYQCTVSGVPLCRFFIYSLYRFNTSECLFHLGRAHKIFYGKPSAVYDVNFRRRAITKRDIERERKKK